MPKSDMQVFRLKGNPRGFTVAERLAFRSSEWGDKRARYKRATSRTTRRVQKTRLMEGFQEFLGPIQAYQQPADRSVTVHIERRKPFTCTLQMIEYLGYDVVFQTPLEVMGDRLFVLRKQDGWIGFLAFSQETFDEQKWFFTNRFMAGEQDALANLAAHWDGKVLWTDPNHAARTLVTETFTWQRTYRNQVVLKHSLLRTLEVVEEEARRASLPRLRRVA